MRVFHLRILFGKRVSLSHPKDCRRVKVLLLYNKICKRCHIVPISY